MTTSLQEEAKSLDHYLTLPYSVRVVRDPAGGYVADVEELPGCVTQAESWEEAGELITDAMRGWIALRLTDGLPVPEPKDEMAPAKILIRLPHSLHRDLLRAAEREGVSLNQFVVYQLGRSLGNHEAAR
jgi:antitoxin HicB